jgi:Holliday junction DNA helicase RuvB
VSDSAMGRAALSAEPLPGEGGFEDKLRPQSLEEMVGQDRLRENLAVFIAAARERAEPLDHLLFYGPPGLGKTSLARIVAREMGARFRATSGPVLDRASDVAALLSNLEPDDVLFIDEIHRLPPAVEEILYPAMEDFALDVMIGKGPSARSLRLSLKPFTIVGATTRAGRISSPLRDRFGATYRLDFYDLADLTSIVERSARLLSVDLSADGATAIARRGRGTPRVVNRLLRRVRDYAQVNGDGRVDAATADKALAALEIDDEGLDSTDRKLLAAVVQKFGSGPVGIQALAAVLSEEAETVEDVYEPFLLRLGFLDRTPQGRIATELARQHLSRLGYEIPPPRRAEADQPALWESGGPAADSGSAR